MSLAQMAGNTYILPLYNPLIPSSLNVTARGYKNALAIVVNLFKEALRQGHNQTLLDRLGL